MRRSFPGCANCFLLATANTPGVRRTRWLDADLTLTREIYDTGPRFEDAVVRGVVIEKGPLYRTDRTFDIPRRCLLPRGIDGLHRQWAQCRRCRRAPARSLTMTVGQGAGVAAAVAALQCVEPRDVPMVDVQHALRDQGVDLG